MPHPIVQPDPELGLEFLANLERLTGDAPGVTRTAYGSGEQAAHQLLASFAHGVGGEVARDYAGNTYVTRPGTDRAAKAILIGSHLDSVPHGGNYDGAAGVAVGLAVLAGLHKAGIRVGPDVTVMATRAEESCWFPASYIGSRMALGRLPADVFNNLVRSDTNRALSDHIAELGFNPDAVRRAERHLDASRIACYIEPHIEQGPVLEAEGYSVAVVEAIAGGPRYRNGTIIGEYAHAGGAPLGYRRDAVAALGDFVHGVNVLWREMMHQGHYSLFTFGIVGTDPRMHTFSRVPGEARFCLDTRAIDADTLRLMDGELRGLIARVEADHGVTVQLGADSGPPIATMNVRVRDLLGRAAVAHDIQFRTMASGAGHDAAAFAAAGVPTGMVFIRNQNGSHNADEKMRPEDFADACRVVIQFIAMSDRDAPLFTEDATSTSWGA